MVVKLNTKMKSGTISHYTVVYIVRCFTVIKGLSFSEVVSHIHNINMLQNTQWTKC